MERNITLSSLQTSREIQWRVKDKPSAQLHQTANHEQRTVWKPGFVFASALRNQPFAGGKGCEGSESEQSSSANCRRSSLSVEALCNDFSACVFVVCNAWFLSKVIATAVTVT